MIAERHVAQSLFACLALSLFSVAHAAEKKPTNDKLPDWAPQPKPHVIEDRFRVEVMTLSADLDTDLRVDPTLATQGTLINAEDDLGLDDHKLMPLAELTLLPGERHLIRLSGFSLRRAASQAIDQTIVFDDQTYLPGERVDSTLNLRLFGFTYGYRLISNERMEVTPTLGVQVGEYSTNAVVRSRTVREPTGDVAPIPVIGADLRYDFTRRLSMEGRVQYMKVELDEIEARLVDWRVGFTWRFNPHFVVGAGYRAFTIDAESFDEDSSGLIDLSMDGPLLYVRASL